MCVASDSVGKAHTPFPTLTPPVLTCSSIFRSCTVLMKALGLDDAVEKPKAPKQEEKTAAVDTDDAPSKKGSKTGGNPKKKKGQKGD